MTTENRETIARADAIAEAALAESARITEEVNGYIAELAAALDSLVDNYARIESAQIIDAGTGGIHYSISTTRQAGWEDYEDIVPFTPNDTARQIVWADTLAELELTRYALTPAQIEAKATAEAALAEVTERRAAPEVGAAHIVFTKRSHQPLTFQITEYPAKR